MGNEPNNPGDDPKPNPQNPNPGKPNPNQPPQPPR
jgi:hypothetical protein